MILVKAPLPTPNPSLKTINLAVDRFKLQKRRWRGRAADGTEFGFELDDPLPHLAPFHQTETALYRIAQEPETVLEAGFQNNPVEGLHVGWSIGNLHMPMQVHGHAVRVADDPAIRQLFAHLKIHYHQITAVFEPIRASTNISHSHGHDHDHSHGHDHHHEHTHD